ncbi:MAG: DNA-processing protein DprA [Bacteroidales bacterium]
MFDDSLRYKIGISLIPKIGPVLTKRLIAYSGSLEAVFHEKKANLLKIPGFGDKIAKEIKGAEVLDIADKEIEYIKKSNIIPLFYLDENYPQRLKQCEDAPVIIYTKGHTDLNRLKTLSIVGTRSATDYGRELCTNLLEGLSQCHSDVLIISGLAYGIDICAHKAALKNNLHTIAVLGHGLGTIYPSTHRNIADQIVNHGALVTEFTSRETPDAPNFVKRNRIIAGLADATIVVESGERGGALITADLANSYNRDVFAFPGKTIDKYSVGCNRLIKTNKAALIEDFKDLEYLMGWQAKKTKEATQKFLFTELNDEEKLVMDLLEKNTGLSIDQIALQCNIPVSRISYLLINLEFNGLVKCLPGKVYKKTG